MTGAGGPDWLRTPPAALDGAALERAGQRQRTLTKPPGSLGRLEELALRLAAMQGSPVPSVDPVSIVVFAADHGVTEEGVSAFPREVTAQMVRNFARGGAAISVLARELGARLEVVDVGTAVAPETLDGVVCERVAAGTANLARQPAMSAADCALALDAGRHAIARARAAEARLFVGGDMGIGNTTAAAALTCAWLGRPPAAVCGPGTGLDRDGVARKAVVVERALALHRQHLHEPFECLRRLGGLEIAALAGACVAAGQWGVPVLVDGFISTVAAAAAARLCPGVAVWFLYAHRSAEPGHGPLLESLDARPLLDLGMRLGEGSGAAVAVPLLRLACALHAGMATFSEAGVAAGPS